MINLIKDFFKDAFAEHRLISIKRETDDLYRVLVDKGSNTIIKRRTIVYKGCYNSSESMTDKIYYVDTGEPVPNSIKRVVKSLRQKLNGYPGMNEEFVVLSEEFATVEAKLNELGL